MSQREIWQAPVEKWATDCALALRRIDQDLESTCRELKRQNDLGKSIRVIAAEVTQAGYRCSKSTVHRLISTVPSTGQSWAEAYAEVNNPSDSRSLQEFQELEEEVMRGDNMVMEGRHQFGQMLLIEESAGTLSDVRFSELVKATGVSRAEMERRKALAEEYPNLNLFWTEFRYWNEFAAAGLPK